MKNLKRNGAGVVVGAGLFAAFFLSACMTMPEGQVWRFIDVPEHRAVLVGKVELLPELRPGEQVLATSFGERFHNVFVLYLGELIRDFRSKKPDTFEGSYALPLGRTFYIEVNKGTTIYLSGGMFFSVYDPPFNIESHTYPLFYKVDVGASDDALYIGTIQFHRDDQNKLRLFAIRDDFQNADQEFKDRFTTATTLRKALLVPVNFSQ